MIQILGLCKIINIFLWIEFLVKSFTYLKKKSYMKDGKKRFSIL
jgi:hypothetical protein